MSLGNSIFLQDGIVGEGMLQTYVLSRICCMDDNRKAILKVFFLMLTFSLIFCLALQFTPMSSPNFLSDPLF